MLTQDPPVQIDKLISCHEFEITGCRGGPRVLPKLLLNQQHGRIQDPPLQF